MKKCRYLVLLLVAIVGLAACSSQKSSSDSSSSKLMSLQPIQLSQISQKISLAIKSICTVLSLSVKIRMNMSLCPKMSKRLLRLTSFSTTVSTLKQVVMLGSLN